MSKKIFKNRFLGCRQATDMVGRANKMRLRKFHLTLTQGQKPGFAIKGHLEDLVGELNDTPEKIQSKKNLLAMGLDFSKLEPGEQYVVSQASGKVVGIARKNGVIEYYAA